MNSSIFLIFAIGFAVLNALKPFKFQKDDFSVTGMLFFAMLTCFPMYFLGDMVWTLIALWVFCLLCSAVATTFWVIVLHLLKIMPIPQEAIDLIKSKFK